MVLIILRSVAIKALGPGQHWLFQAWDVCVAVVLQTTGWWQDRMINLSEMNATWMQVLFINEEAHTWKINILGHFHDLIIASATQYKQIMKVMWKYWNILYFIHQFSSLCEPILKDRSLIAHVNFSKSCTLCINLLYHEETIAFNFRGK